MSPAQCEMWFGLLEFLKAGGTVLVAAIGVMAAAVAWLFKGAVAGAISYHARLVERLELMKALHAEMSINIENEESWNDKAKAGILNRMAAYGYQPYDFTPYAPIYAENPIYDNLRLNITALPTEAVEPVVRYYNESNGLTEQIRDLRSIAFATLGKERRMAAVEGIYEDAAACARTGRESLSTLNKFIDREATLIVSMRFGAAALAVIVLVMATVTIKTRGAQIISTVLSASSCYLKTSGHPALPNPVSYMISQREDSRSTHTHLLFAADSRDTPPAHPAPSPPLSRPARG